MRKIVLNVAVSLDGFIARKNGEVDWLDHLDTGESDLGFSAFLDSCDTIIMGRKSYDVTLSLGNNQWPFTEHQTYVFSTKMRENKDKISFINHDIKSFINGIKNQDGKNIWLFGGSSFIQQVRELDEVDELIITTIPVMIGNGIRLFEDSNLESSLVLKDVTKVNNIITSHYVVKR